MHRLALLLIFCTSQLASAQAPSLNPSFPCGIQRGTTLELTLTGQNVHEPLSLLTSFPLKVTFIEPLTDPAKVVARLEVPADAPLGWHTLRLHTRRGISNVRPFCIDELPQVLQAGNPFSPDKAQTVKLPCVVCGTIQPDQRHYYAIQLNANQRLCAEILGRRLGSPLDPSLTLFEAATGKQVEFVDDSPGLQKDARFAFTAPRAGLYHLEVRDVAATGGNDWHYRLRLGDFPLASTAFPLAMQRGAKSAFTFAGLLVDQTATFELTAPTDPAIQAISVTPRFAKRPGSQAGWPVQVMLSDLNERTASIARIGGPNPTNASFSLTIPGAISGILLEKGEKHSFRFTLQAGIRYSLQTTTHELGSPATINLKLTDPQGSKVASSNPEADTAQIDFTPTQAGEYLLTVEHQHYGGGPDQSYRLAITTHTPSFTLSSTVDRIDIARGNHAVLIVQADRAGGYTGPIELKIEKPEHLTGSAIIPAGQSTVMLPLTAAPEMPLVGSPLVISGTAKPNTSGKREYVRIPPLSLRGRGPGGEEMFGASPPLSLSTLPALSVQPAVPFTLTTESIHGPPVRGMEMLVRFTLTRDYPYNGEIKIQSMHIPDQKPSIGPLTTMHSSGQSEAYGKHMIAADAPDLQPVAYQAKATVDGREVTITTMPSVMKLGPPLIISTRTTSAIAKPMILRKGMPMISPFLLRDLLSGPSGVRVSLFDLRTLPNPLSETAVEVIITRQGDYTGPVQVKLINLPDKVFAGVAILPPGQDRVMIPLAVSPGAKPLTRNNIHVEATATALVNQKALSQPVSVTIK